ncbi:MAG TPA: hypothetical protein VJC00_04095 [Candidatus Nanoarchaeia archaeon]|nr:hypothetical protein [Candidatus Nanoarchaeia archaeon]
MPWKVPGLKTRVKYYGIFDFKQIYRDIKEKLIDLGYMDSVAGSRNMMETYYSEKRSSDPREAKTMWLWWRTKKREEGSPFYEQQMGLDFHLRYVKDVEVMFEGEKKRAQQGEIEVWVKGDLMIDPDDEWKNHWFLKHFLSIMVRRIWRKQRESRKNSTITDTLKLQAFVKESFEVLHFMPLKGESFYDSMGYKPRP